MRIAMMTNNYKPFVGGVPISIERLADSLRDLGHSVYVFAPDYKSPVDDDEYTFRFPTMKHKIAGAIPIPNLIYGYVKNAISTLDIDLIHVHHPVMIGNVATRVRASVERREDRAVREVMNKAALERSTIPQNGWWQIRRDDCMGA